MSFKILFMGTPTFSVPILKSLNLSSHKILEVYTQPPKKKDRGQRIRLSPVHKYSNEINIPVRYPSTLETQAELEHIKKLKPDVVHSWLYQSDLIAGLIAKILGVKVIIWSIRQSNF